MKKNVSSLSWILVLPLALAALIVIRDRAMPRGVRAPAPHATTISRPGRSGQIPVAGASSAAPVPTNLAPVPAAPAQSPILIVGSASLLPGQIGSPPATAEDQQFVAIQQQAHDGDVVNAEAQLRKIAAGTNPTIAARGQLMLGQLLLMNGDNANGQKAFQDYLARFATGADAAQVHFALGELAFQQGNRDLASSELHQYLKQTTDHVLDGPADVDLAQIAQASGDSTSATSLDQAAVEAGIPLSEDLNAASVVGKAMLASGHASGAADWYATLAARPGNDPTTRAHYEFLQASALQQSGDKSGATAIFRGLLANPAAGVDTGATIDALQALGATVDDFAAGEALLNAKQYTGAVQSLGNYLDQNPQGPDAATARYDRGQALMGQSDYSSAAAQLDRFVALYPNDRRFGAAVLLEGKSIDLGGNPTQAAQFLQTFASQHPSDASAPQALADAAQYLKSASQASAALPVEQKLIVSFPTSPLVPAAAFDVGWADYEKLDFNGARAVWQNVLDRFPTNPGSPPSLLWLGKLEQRDGNATAAERDFQLAWQANPGDYYAFRAHDLLTGSAKSAGSSPLVEPSTAELAKEQSDLNRWLATWTNPTAEDRDLPYLGAPISRGNTLKRISALAALGLQSDLSDEIKQAMGQYADDGRSLYALADTLNQAGLTTDALDAAYQALMISPAPNAYQSPVLLQRLVYPFPYRDLITRSAQKYGVDPLLLVALIRQESAFNPNAHSVTGALGLTQFEPATAQGVAQQIGLANFTLDQLNQPPIAIELAAAYLASQTKVFGGNPIFALAAYNAGGGSLQTWLADNPRQDLDLLVEEIPFQQTNDYVRLIYRFYDEYQFVYRSPTGG
ncbi:MAG: transglycosylase SLT domain-containing protein [Chloroflexota bacterium]